MSVPNLRFEVMQYSDIPEVAAIEAGVFSQPWSEHGFRSALEQDCSLYLVARTVGKNKIVGYCGLLQSFDEADIVNVAVREDERGRGIGCAMLLRLMELGRERGILRFTLEVRRSNQAALRLYEKLGFFPAGIRKNFYERPVEDAVIMWTRDP